MKRRRRKTVHPPPPPPPRQEKPRTAQTVSLQVCQLYDPINGNAVSRLLPLIGSVLQLALAVSTCNFPTTNTAEPES
ncbi:hypothetical protein FQA47_008343 [Oryzias melastigma]|uniref:Uncharacterized protein n=1 Tax=Oryzias melastigma TaxID=30732 RepID=A0A834CNT0_ORYME|nr:hypothetical protein FQA47_008343 [Oryzias melastigma]